MDCDYTTYSGLRLLFYTSSHTTSHCRPSLPIATCSSLTKPRYRYGSTSHLHTATAETPHAYGSIQALTTASFKMRTALTRERSLDCLPESLVVVVPARIAGGTSDTDTPWPGGVEHEHMIHIVRDSWGAVCLVFQLPWTMMLDHHRDTNGSLALGFGKTHHRHLLCRLEERF